MDTDLLLTCESLRLSSTISRGAVVDGAFTVKCVHSQGYLTIDADQAQVLDSFSEVRTVPEVLEESINSRRCPRLREFYELVLSAHRSGILCTDQVAPERRPAVRWFVGLPPAVSALIGFILPVAMLASLAINPPVRPVLVLDLVVGWVASCAALSLGSLWAASAIRGAECEVYRPHFRWQSLTPHFAIDTRDICMAGALARAAVYMAPTAAISAVLTAALWLHATWSLIVFLAFFFVSRPAIGGSLVRVFELLRRKPLRDTDRASSAGGVDGTGATWMQAWTSVDLRSAAAQLGYGIVWSAALGYVAYRNLGVDPRILLHVASVWKEALLLIVVLLVAAVSMRLLLTGCRQTRAWSRRAWATGKLAWRRWRVSKELSAVTRGTDALLRRSLLLRRLRPPEMAELAREVRAVHVGAWTKLVDFDAEPTEVGVIVSGRVAVYRRTATGRKTRFLHLSEGDLFGAHSLMDPENPRLEVRTKTPCILLLIPRDTFERLVLRPLGPTLVCAYLHKLPFLQHSRLCAHWRPAAIARFIEITRTATYPAGSRIIDEGSEVRMLAVVYQGKARALHGCKQIGQIRAGEVMGEISLLQCSAATATVEAVEETRCLMVDRSQFIRFMSRNHHVALDVERIASRRLGRPIFPLSRNSFEAH